MEKRDGENLSTEVEKTSKDVRLAVFLVAIASIIQLTVAGIYTYNDHQERKQEKELRTQEFRLEAFEKQYDRQTQKYEQIQYPIIALREDLEEINKICQKQALTLQDKQDLANFMAERRKNKVALVQAYGGVQLPFGMVVFNQIKDFVAQEEKIESLPPCSPATPASFLWKEEGNTIGNMMLEKMGETAQTILNILAGYR